MLEFAEFVEPDQEHLLRLLPQIGVSRVTSPLPRAGGSVTSSTLAAATRRDRPWSDVPLTLLRQFYLDHGLELAVVEDSPPLDRVRLGLDGREEEAGWFCDQIRAMGRLGIGVLCWNFMAGSGWTRTSVAVRGRGGALVSSFRQGVVDAPPPLASLGDLTSEAMWDNLRWFLERVVPVAEASGVRLALHPDDPPLSPLRGVPRIQTSVADLERALDLVPSRAHALTLCQGNVALMTDDLPAVIRRLARREAIAFVHVRDVRGTAADFVETFHDDGPTDMVACFQAYEDAGVDAPMRVDHVPTLDGDSNARPGYSTLGRLFAVGYLTGLREAVGGADRSTSVRS